MARSKPTARRDRAPIWHAQSSGDASTEQGSPTAPPIIPPGLQHWPVFLLEETQGAQHVLADLYAALDPVQDAPPTKRQKLESSSSNGSKTVTLTRYSIILASLMKPNNETQSLTLTLRLPPELLSSLAINPSSPLSTLDPFRLLAFIAKWPLRGVSCLRPIPVELG
jgi:hypothetical protein